MAALAKQDSEPEVFVGQVFARSSPVLTWRPALAAKAAREAAEEMDAEELVDLPESSVYRISRAPTRRMVAWPVVSKVQGGHVVGTGWMIARGVLVSVVAAAALVAAVGGGVLAWPSRGVAQIAPPAAKVVAVHTIDEGKDAIAPATSTLANAVATKAPAAPSHGTPRPAPRGRAQHGHRAAHTAHG